MSDSISLLPAAIRAVASHNVDADALANSAMAQMRSQGLITPHRIAMFIGQCSEETGGFTVYSEDLNYRAARLLAVFPSHFTAAEAAEYAGSPIAIANRIYANRYGNGDEVSGDGWRFRGGGWLQVTFRDTYTALGKSVGMSPEAASDWARTSSTGAAASACWYWGYHGGLNELADAWDIAGVTKKINGGLINLETRIAACNAALGVFPTVITAAQGPIPPTTDADTLMAEEQAGRTFPTQPEYESE